MAEEKKKDKLKIEVSQDSQKEIEAVEKDAVLKAASKKTRNTISRSYGFLLFFTGASLAILPLHFYGSDRNWILVGLVGAVTGAVVCKIDQYKNESESDSEVWSKSIKPIFFGAIVLAIICVIFKQLGF